MQLPHRVLVVEDDPDVRLHVGEVLAEHQVDVVEAETAARAVDLVMRQDFEVVLLDIRLPDQSGLEVLRAAKRAEVDAEFVVMTAYADVETAVEAMRLGAYDVLLKPFLNALLVEAIGKAAETRMLRRDNSALRQVVARTDQTTIVGESPQMQALMELIARAAKHTATVLIQGESGTGKELVARAIHHHSLRSDKPFVAVNCGALTESLLETDLFGHRKGAFTGAVASRAGFFEVADGGTLLLDEIAEMSAAMQVRLLRVLNSGEVWRIGDERPFRVDVRIIGATVKDLQQEVAGGRFREDLYYRVSTVVLQVPPLRERTGDIPLLIRHFAGPSGGGRGLHFSEPALDLLERYAWPGNVRQLQNLLERLTILYDDETIQVGHLPLEIRVPGPSANPSDASLRPLIEIERWHIQRILVATQGNKAEAARILGIDVKTLSRKLSSFTRPPKP